MESVLSLQKLPHHAAHGVAASTFTSDLSWGCSLRSVVCPTAG